MKNEKDIIASNTIFGWIALGTALLLSIPLIAMQFTEEVNWSPGDFIVMGILVFCFGTLFVAIARVVEKKYRLLVGMLLLLAFLYVRAELAVGVFTSLGS